MNFSANMLGLDNAATPIGLKAMQQLQTLKGCEVHSTVLLSQVDANIFRKLGVNLTCEPKYQTNRLYQKSADNRRNTSD